MSKPSLFVKTETREFFAHHMLLHASALEIADAEETQVSRFNRCLAAMVMTSLAVEALLNAVGARVVQDWKAFERLPPSEKLDLLISELGIDRQSGIEPWTTLRFIFGFRNDIAHPKPEQIVQTKTLPEAALNLNFSTPMSSLEEEITLGNAKRVYSAVASLKGILTDSLSPDLRFGIYADAWSHSTSEKPHEA